MIYLFSETIYYIGEVIGILQKSACVLIIDNNHNCVYKRYVLCICVCV